ncbi:MAG: hypothetical protein R3360_01445 [Alphaproteobacteria bacterium]|nr:hypothetical protein [Alphaproteobacteria bacterium]
MNIPPRRAIGSAAALSLALAMLAAGAATAQDLDCTECHDDVTVTSPAHPDFACTDCHTNVSDEHPDGELEPLADADSCGGCHRSLCRRYSGAQC